MVFEISLRKSGNVWRAAPLLEKACGSSARKGAPLSAQALMRMTRTAPQAETATQTQIQTQTQTGAEREGETERVRSKAGVT
eukprot:3231417-Rhodomonas_salina.1